jgi:hypothetical protein
MSIDRDGHIADAKGLADVGFIASAADGQLHSIQIEPKRNIPTVLVAADKEIASQVNLLLFAEKAGYIYRYTTGCFLVPYTGVQLLVTL